MDVSDDIVEEAVIEDCHLVPAALSSDVVNESHTEPVQQIITVV